VPNELHFAWKPRLLTFGLLCLAAVVVFWWNIKRKTKTQAVHWVTTVLGIFIVFYIIIIFLNSLALDASTSEGGMRRYLVPVFVSFVIWIILVFHHFAWTELTHWGPRLLFTVIALGLLGLYFYQFATFIREPGYVLGYTDFKNQSPNVVAALQAIEPDRTLITNDYEATYYLAGRPAMGLPRETDNFTGQPNPEYSSDMQRVMQMLQDGAVLVVIDEGPDPSLEILTPRLVRWQSFGRVIFYVLPEIFSEPGIEK
jgi:hypothetical protein